MTTGQLRELLIRAFRRWNDDNAVRMAASLAFYSILAFAPLVLFIVAIGGKLLDSDQLQATILRETRAQMGAGSISLIRDLMDSARNIDAGAATGIISIGLALLGASGLFDQLTSSFNVIWKIGPREGHPVRMFLLAKLLSVAMVLIFLSVILLWIGIDSVVGYMRHHLNRGFPLWHQVSFVISLAFLTGVFGVTFKSLPHGRVAWKDVWLPAFLTSLGFSISKYLLSFYFGLSSVGARYGPAGALVILLLWFYYSAQIFFYGAELTFAYAYTHGSHRAEVAGELEMS